MKQEIEALLNSLEKLLDRVHAYWHRDEVARIHTLLSSDATEAYRIMMSNDFWGGAGSFFDLMFSEANRNVSDDFSRDNWELQHLLLAILLHLKANGYTRSDFDFIESYLRKRLT